MAEPTLRPGSSGEVVRQLQGAQHIGVDGIVGPQTWDKIDALGD